MMSKKRRIFVSIICLLSIACLFGNMAYALASECGSAKDKRTLTKVDESKLEDQECQRLPVEELEMLLEEYPNTENTENRLVIHADQGEHEISRFIYGHFAEHLGRGIYDGIWVGEDSPIPNTRGIRNDIVEALKKIKVPVMRWPGGCFADEYHWMDGIGPKEDRPVVLNTQSGKRPENNYFGTHEFMDFCEQVGCEPYICGNVGSGTVEELSKWVEYMTFGGSSTMSDLRRKNGRDKPWKVKYWAVGNENEGCGGSMPPEYYAYLYRRFQTYMNSYSDNELYKVACGPIGTDFNWLDVLMEKAGDYTKGIAIHNYVWSGERTQSSINFEEDDWFFLLRRSFRQEELLKRSVEIMDKYDPEKNVSIIFDEWGAWHEEIMPGVNPSDCYQQSTLRDAMVAAIHFNIFHRYADRIHMANIAQTVNVIQAIILTQNEKMILTPTYHVFDMYKVHQDATYLPLELDCGTYAHQAALTQEISGDSRDRPYVDHFGPLNEIPALTATASRDDAGKIHISIANIDPNKGATVRCEIRGADFKKVSGSILTSPKINTHNTFDNPDAIKPAEFSNVKIKGDQLVIKMPSKSIVVLELD